MRATQLLMEEHQIILRGLGVLEVLAAKAVRGDPVPAPAVDALLAFLSEFADAHHHGKEETILFPALEEAGLPRDAGPVGVMLSEHVQGRSLISALRAAAPLASSTPDARARFADAARAYGQLLSAHIDKENHVLFPMADRAIAREDQQRLDGAFDAFEREFAPRRVHHEGAVARLWKELL
jgi:hemerythrin-like domain-containing protein